MVPNYSISYFFHTNQTSKKRTTSLQGGPKVSFVKRFHCICLFRGLEDSASYITMIKSALCTLAITIIALV